MVWSSCSGNPDTHAHTQTHTQKKKYATLFFNYFYKSENALQQLLFLLFHFDDYDDTSQENVMVCRLAVIARGGGRKLLTREIDVQRDCTFAILSSCAFL